MQYVTLLLFAFLVKPLAGIPYTYYIDDSRGPARIFEGIGAVSAGGSTALLPMYSEPFRSQVLDLLFMPSFGASLQVLKVEIGSEAQATDGSEAAHQRNPWEKPNFERGYEYWLMKEAKKRNTNCKIYGLPWAWPRFLTCSSGTLSNCTGENPFSSPQRTAEYIVNWVRGAASHGVIVDFVGEYNERLYDVNYTLALREQLDAAGFNSTRIVLSDNHDVDDVVADMARNPSFANIVYALSQHYPGSYSSPAAESSEKPIWASEDSSTFNNGVGAGCWSREVNQNFVRGNMTSSYCWNLITAYTRGTNWFRAGLMNALQPWSGTYGSLSMIWASAHTTQFSYPGWHYLVNGTGTGTGSGLLARGGSYVTLQAPGDEADFSIIIEKMTPDHSPCVRWHVFDFTTEAENATFQLVGGPARVTQLQLFRTHFSFDVGNSGDEGTSYFEKLSPINIINGAFTLLIEPDTLYTLSTLTTGQKGNFPTPPPPAFFPPAHIDDFDTCVPPGRAQYFLDQSGQWECVNDTTSGRGVVMQQMTPLKPLPSGGDCRPHSLLGSRDSVNSSLTIDVRLTSNSSAIIAARLVRADTDAFADYAGVIFSVNATGSWTVTESIGSNEPRTSGTLQTNFSSGVWHTLRLDVNGSVFNVWIDDTPILTSADASWAGLTGLNGIGTIDYGHFTDFDYIKLYTTQRTCGISAPVDGDALVAVPCAVEVGLRLGGQFVFIPVNSSTCPFGSPCRGGTGRFALASNKNLCLSTAVDTSEPWRVILSLCSNSSDQIWIQNYVQLYETSITHNDSGRPLCVETPHVGSNVIIPLSGAPPNSFCGDLVFSGDEQEIVSMDTQKGGFCLGICS
jgi:galactosylceramidase